MRIRTQEFVTAWQGSATVAEVAERTGYSARYCSQRAARLRASGLDLKRFTGGGVSLADVQVPDPVEAAALLALRDDEDPGRVPVAEDATPEDATPTTRRPVDFDEEAGSEDW